MKTIEEIVKEKELYTNIEKDYYNEFIQQEGIPNYVSFFIDDLRTLALEPWQRMGGSGAYVNLFGEETWGDSYVCEIPPGENLKPQRHMFEEVVYVLSGNGATSFWTREDGPKGTFEWQEQSLFVLPANIGYQHFNGDGTRPARIFSKTTLPAMFQYFKSRKFLFENDFTFEEIEKDFFSADAQMYRDKKDLLAWATNFVPDVRGFDKMTSHPQRGKGTTVYFRFPGCSRLYAHQSEFPVGTYKKAHSHPAGRAIILITGKGYSLVWQPGKEAEKKRVDWKAGTLLGVGLSILQGECWFHQHFNTGNEPARYLVLHVNPRLSEKHVTIEYEDEDPEIRKLYESELAKSGVTIKMAPVKYNVRK